MPVWITPVTVAIPTELCDAEYQSRRRTSLDRYRSRTEVTNEHIWTAYAWLRLPLINREPQEVVRSVLLYKTAPVTRGVSPAEALENAKSVLQNAHVGGRKYNVVMFNTRTDAANSAKIKEWLDANEGCTELTQYTTMLVSAPTHKINLYKRETEDQTTYIILNNLDTAPWGW